MKQHYAKIILFCLCCLVGAKASAYDFEVDGIYYCHNSDGISVSVSSGGNKYNGIVEIPKSVTYGGKTYSVTSIGSDAFRECSGLTSVTIPNSVTSIGLCGFYSCSSLISVNIPNSVTNIGWSAFSGCSSLISVNIPNSVTSIGLDAFSGCSSLTSVTIPNSVTSIGWSTFYGCSGLTSVTIPNSVTSIGRSAFRECSSLTSVTIPNSVTSIGESAFERCVGLTSVTIPNSVTSIGDGAFGNCSGLTSINVDKANKTFDSRDDCNAIIVTETNVLMIGCKNTIIPNNVASIGSVAFLGCSDLTSVTIPNSVTSIGNYAFSGCSGLTSLTIPNSVTSIGENAFSGCSGLTIIKVDEANTIYDSRDNCNAIIKTENNELVTGCKNTIIPNNVASIGSGAFWGCSDLTSVTIPNSVTSIGDDAFGYCSNLTSVNIPNSVTTIGSGAFNDCSGLTSVTIPNSLTSIGNYAFSHCDNIKEIVCQVENVFSIEDETFSDAVYSTAKLIVPKGTKEKYSTTAAWNKFQNIEESDFAETTGIKPAVAGQKVENVYRIDGKAAGKRFKGLNILRLSDGSVRKVMVK